MGKKGIKSKKTKWLTISLSDTPITDKNECTLATSKLVASATRKSTTAALFNKTSIQTASSTTSSIISTSSTATDTPFTVTDKCPSLASNPSSYHYRSYKNNYHHSNNSQYAPSAHNSTNYSNSETADNQYHDSRSGEERSNSYNSGPYRRRPYRGGGAPYGSRRLPRSSYNYSNRSYSQHTNDSEKSEQNSTTPKTSKFNEDEYTRITTPRQDVLFKKGYLSRPKKYTQLLTENGDGTATSTEGSSTPVSSECGYKSNESPDIDYASMYSPGYVDENGVFIVNPFYMDGYNFYNSAMMMYSPTSQSHCQQHRAMNPMNYFSNFQYMPVDITDECIDEPTDTLPSQDEIDTKDSDSTEDNSAKETVKTDDTADDAVTNCDLNKETGAPESVATVATIDESEGIDEGVDETMHVNGIDGSYGYFDIPANMYPFYYPGYVFGQVPFVPISSINYNDSYADIENEADDGYTKTDLKKLNGSKAEIKDALDSSGVTSTDFSGDDDSSDCSFENEIKRCTDLGKGRDELLMKNQNTITSTSTVPKIISNLNVEVEEFHPRNSVTINNTNVVCNNPKQINDIQEHLDQKLTIENNGRKFSLTKQSRNVQKSVSLEPKQTTVVVAPPKVEPVQKKAVKKSTASLTKKVLIESTKLIEEQNIDLTKKPESAAQNINDWSVVGTKGKRKPVKEGSMERNMEEKRYAKSPEKTKTIVKVVEKPTIPRPEIENEQEKDLVAKKPEKIENIVVEDSSVPPQAKNRKSKSRNKKKTAKRTLILNNIDTFTVIEPDFIVKKFNIKEQFAQVADADLELIDDIDLQLELEDLTKPTVDDVLFENVKDFLPDEEEINIELNKCIENEITLEANADEKNDVNETDVVENWAEEVEAVSKEKEQVYECSNNETSDEENDQTTFQIINQNVDEPVFVQDCLLPVNEHHLPTIDESAETESCEVENFDLESLETQIVNLKVSEEEITHNEAILDSEESAVNSNIDPIIENTSEPLKCSITDAVSKWLVEARKDEQATKPIFVIPEDTVIINKIKNSISDWLYESYQNENFDDIDIETDSDIDNSDADAEAGADNFLLNKRNFNGTGNELNATGLWQENDTDSDYMSDIQVKNSDSKANGNRNSFDDDTSVVANGNYQINSSNTLISDRTTKNAKGSHSCLIM